MRIDKRIGAGFLVLGLLLSGAQAADAAPPSTARPAADTVTLITGDQVTLHDSNAISVHPGKGREKMTFSRATAGGHTYVIPADAHRLVAMGRIDRRLFDITTLIKFGYHDTVPLIVTHPAGQAAPRAGRVSRELPSINGIAMAADKANAGAVWEALTDGSTTRTTTAGVSTVWLDGKRKSTLDHSASQIGAPTAWEAGLTGTGVKVAVLDSGVDQTHPDLADREIAEQNFSDAPDNVDNVGHGTHVASILAGTGGKYRGIANGASILDGKVLDDYGYGTESGIIAGMEWAARQGADIANMSLGGPDGAEVDPIEQAVESLSAQYGILFVVAAGNSGPDAESIGSPGSAPSALTVGAVDRENALADFSSRGPTVGNYAIKPDITAPGVGIVAALHSAGTINDPVEDGYTALSGTSMATPHVAGAAALLAQQHPDWTGQQLKAALTGSATATPGPTAFEQGAGRVDVARALGQTVVTEPAVVDLGVAAWPHDDDEPLTRTLTYRNLGDADVTLDLAVDAPTAVFSLSTNQITVPAGGTAEVTVIGDTSLGTGPGSYSGTVVATSGDSVTRTPVGVTREDERYSLTLNYVDEHGAPTSDYSTILMGMDDISLRFPYDADGSVTVRLPKGRYLVNHGVLTSGDHFNEIAQPGIALDHDQTFDIDPAIAKPVSITPPKAATMSWADLGYEVAIDGRVFGSGLVTNFDVSHVSTAQLGDPLPGTTTTNWVSTHWSDTDGAVYGLAWFPDEFPTGLTKDVRWGDLATLRWDFGPGTEGQKGLPFLYPQPKSGSATTYGVGSDVTLPGTRTAYVTTENVRWGVHLWLTPDFFPVDRFDSPLRSYRPGRTYHERYNHPVFGPGLPPADVPWAFRTADEIWTHLPLFTDSGGNAGFPRLESGSMRLYLGDQLVGEGWGYFPDLPSAAGDYRLTVEATRPARFDLSTSVNAEWTFSSSHVDGEKALDLNVVRFLPKLAGDGSAKAGKPFLVPLQVQDETGAIHRPRRLTVEASYDEGKSWQRVPVTSNQVAKLHHPAGATSVSLRASATDRDGNTVEQTVIRAYKLR